MRNNKFRDAFLIGPVVIAALSASSAFAQSESGDAAADSSRIGTGDIIVTARRREETLQTTPLAITAVTAETLEARGITDFSQIARIAPNFTLYETSGGLGSAGLYMRGIGYADNIPGQDSPIAIYSDGVLLGRNGVAMMDIVEPERVEVLRGPQGTLFGRNTTGGAVLVTTHEPDDETSAMAKASWGRFNAIRAQMRLDTGYLGETGLKASVAYSHSRRDGVMDDIDRENRRDPGAKRVDSLWGKLVGEWGDFRAVLVADHSKLSGYPQTLQIIEADANYRAGLALSPGLGGGSYEVTQKPLFKLQDAQEDEQHVKSRGVGLTLEYNASDSITVKAIGGLRDFKRSDPSAYGPGNFTATVYQGGFGDIANDFFVNPPPPTEVQSFEGFYNITSRNQEHKQRTLELQLLGSYDSFDFVAGGYYYWDEARDRNTVRLPFPLSLPGYATGGYWLAIPQARDYTAKTESFAAFAQANWRPAFADEKLELTGGIRWTEDKKSFDQTVSFARELDFKNDNVSFLASVKYQFTPDAMAYARYSTGFRSGGYNARAPLGSNPYYQPEKLKAMEAGFKLDLLDRRLRLNGAIFYNDYKNLQVAGFVAPSATDQGGNIAVNANAEYKGFELEAQAIPMEGLTLRANFGYVDPEFKNYPTALDPAPNQIADGCTPINNNEGALAAQDCASVARFTYFAKTNMDFSAEYKFDLTTGSVFTILGTASYKSKVDFDVFYDPITNPWQAEIQEPGYWLFSARMAISEIPLTNDVTAQVAVYGDNLTNEKYSIQSIDFRNYATAYWGLRRTFGIEAKFSF